MDEKKTNSTGGKRVKKSYKGLVALIICVCLVLAAAGAYIGLCSWATDRILPNSVAQGLYLEGLKREQAQERLQELVTRYDNMTIDMIYDDTVTVFEADKADVAFNINAVLDEVTVGGSFLSRGAAWLGAMTGEGPKAEQPMMFAEPIYIDGLVTELNTLLTNPVEQHSFQVEEGSVRVVRGWAGQAIHTEDLEEALLTKVLAGDDSPLMLEATITEPDAPDFQALYDLVYIEPVDSALDLESLTITPHVTGVSIDVDAVKKQFNSTVPGDFFQVELVYTEPAITTEILTENLFAHKLGDAYSYVSGSEARVSNVALAGSFCHETILLPGDVFSYWDHIAPCSKEQGFLDAPTYLNGLTVPGIGGGICQVSSTIYTAVLESNLEVVERNPHSYIPNYLPNGSDAMVNGGSSDFKFANNTAYPIQIRITTNGRNLTAEIWGTKTDDTYVVMEHYDVEVKEYTTKYKIDATVPVGTTREDVTPYTGYTTVSYRTVYAGDGTRLSRTKEGASYYLKRDQVIAINPADAAKYNVDPTTGEPLPEPSPEVTPAPSVTGDPAVTPSTPVVAPTPGVTPTPAVTPSPEVTSTPEVSPSPEVTPAPEVTPTPEVSPSPEVTPTPEVSPSPEVSPEVTPVTETSAAPSAEPEAAA